MTLDEVRQYGRTIAEELNVHQVRWRLGDVELVYEHGLGFKGYRDQELWVEVSA